MNQKWIEIESVEIPGVLTETTSKMEVETGYLYRVDSHSKYGSLVRTNLKIIFVPTKVLPKG